MSTFFKRTSPLQSESIHAFEFLQTTVFFKHTHYVMILNSWSSYSSLPKENPFCVDVMDFMTSCLLQTELQNETEQSQLESACSTFCYTITEAAFEYPQLF